VPNHSCRCSSAPVKGGEGVVQRELAWPASGGVDRILDCAVTEVALGGEASGLLLEIEDITQHRRLTRENALLAQLGGSRLMVRQLAHEIKNPLGGLRGAAQLLERELLDPALREYTRVIISEADRLTNLLDCMLGPGRPPAKQLVNVHELLERVYRLLRGEAHEEVAIERDYDPSLPAIEVDPNHIIQAMLNLGRNAIQALSGGPRRIPRPAEARGVQTPGVVAPAWWRSPCGPASRPTSASAGGAIGWWPRFSSRTTARACPRTFATRFSIRSSRAAPKAQGSGSVSRRTS
jgi:hypothetical protein